MAWAWLVLGGLFEVAFTTCLRHVDGFRNIGWTLGFLASVTLSMGLLALAARSIPMGTAYAIWAGIGAAGSALLGIALFGEPRDALRLALLAGLIGCIVGLKLVGNPR